MTGFTPFALSERQQEQLGGGTCQVTRVVRLQRRQAGSGSVADTVVSSTSLVSGVRAQRRLEQARLRLRGALAQAAPALDDLLDDIGID